MEKPTNITQNDWLLLNKKYPKNIYKIIDKINKGYPIQYLIGNVDFFGCSIEVNKYVLIPRFETELLVDIAINKIKSNLNDEKLEIVDFGTGSGCIAIKLAQMFKKSNVTAIEKSKNAIKLAQKNAIQNQVEINFINNNFKDFDHGKYDVLISNPPYISYKGLISTSVKKYEPKMALYAKKGGLYYYEQILITSKRILKNKNIIFFEIGYNQKEPLETLIRVHYPKSNIIFMNDYNGFERICVIENCL